VLLDITEVGNHLRAITLGEVHFQLVQVKENRMLNPILFEVIFGLIL